MKITFRLRFSTQPGQSIWLDGAHPLPGHAVALAYRDPYHWETSVLLAVGAANMPLIYSYQFRQADGRQATDWGCDRVIVPARFACAELLVLDSWNAPGSIENAFYAAPFKKILLAERRTDVKCLVPADPTHTFWIKAPLLEKHQTLCLVGEGDMFGHWQTARPVLLGRMANEDYFSAQLDLRRQPFPFAYKYGVFDVERNAFVRFEDGENRVLNDEIAGGKHTLINDGFTRLPFKPWHGAGLAVPVFSLRSETGFGVGEFLDLKRLADWGRKAGLKLIQLLPVNDTSATGTWRDSYPYAAVSAFALHPIYLNLDGVASAKNRKLLRALEPERQRLNALDVVDYEAVMAAKLGFLRQIFPLQRAATFRTKAYQNFFADNQHWLVPYAAFCFLRDRSGTPDFNRWPEHQKFDAGKIATLAKNHAEIGFFFFIQYHLHVQLREAAAYIHATGLVLKGDIAIGVSRHGADTWQSPELYHLDMQAGAPPDPFAAKGQNWGFPTYNWLRMSTDGFAWWKQRFAQMGNYFDAFRIDHILGFFRIWSIPTEAVEGILGHFVPALAVEPAEFAAHGIHFNRERLSRPFITKDVLREIFEAEEGEVRRDFLIQTAPDNYSLKPEFATQRQVESHFERREKSERNAKLKTGLFDLISNVILLEAGGKLHFRFAMEQTLSFKTLAPDQQAGLCALYVDYFFRRQDDLWMREAMQKLPALKRVTDMLICGEDLGLVPACVPEVMRAQGFLSLEIQRMPKAMNVEFSRPAEAPYLSVVTPSTHDMSTIRGWWAEDRILTGKFFNHELGRHGEASREASPEIVEAVVRQHLASPAMWSIFQLQDLLGMDGRLRRADASAERINVPAIPNYYWRYRLHLTLEQLLREESFTSHLRGLLAVNQR